MEGWISVKDKLPEPNKLVLLYCTYHRWNDPTNKWQTFAIGGRGQYNSSRLSSICSDEGDIENVTHWMPLPEPPTVENEPS